MHAEHRTGRQQSFTQSQSIQLAGASYNLQSADINGDGNLDLVFVRGSVGVILWGRGDGTFSGPTHLKPSTTSPMDAAAVADFNNDGRLDVALLSGSPCRPDPDRGACGAGNVNTVWMYKNNGGTSFTLTTHTQFTAQAGAILPADINGDLNQDLIHYNPFASGMDPVLGPSGGYNYALGLGNETLGTQGTLPGSAVSAAAFRDMDGDGPTMQSSTGTTAWLWEFRQEAGRTVLRRIRQIWPPKSAGFQMGQQLLRRC